MIKNCLECKSHAVIADPDPSDWFCDDDSAVVCTECENPTRNVDSRYASDRNQFRAVAISARPYNLEKESSVPKWCPLGFYCEAEKEPC